MSDIQSPILLVLQLISAEITLYYKLKDDVNSIKRELQYISSRLMNAEERAEGDDTAKDWLTQVRDFAFDIEDAVERYQLFLKKDIISKLISHLSGDVSEMASKMKSLLEDATRITGAGNRLMFISDIGSQQGQCSNSQARLSRSLNQCTTMTAGYDVVEDDIAKQEIIDLLLNFQNVDGRPSTIAVVGMRGLGKTTVVQSVYYDNTTVRSEFLVRAWVLVSECRQEDAILRSMIVQLSTATDKLYSMRIVNTMDEASLQRLLQEYIHRKRYMFVFDNVQEGDVEMIKNIKALLDTNKEKSKILITTRYQNVAHAWLNGLSNGLYKCKPLPENKAWELFCKTTFHESGESCPSRLHDLARKIVKKCGGLPPVIISVGSLLSNRADDLSEWNKVNHSLGFYLDNQQLSGINRAFMQSYYDLPFKLRPCFLYFGLFPKRFPISRMRLLRLWIAEGFIREGRGNLTLEEIAEEYMNELINMSVIEVKSRDPSGRVKTLGVVSKFLHEMILSKLHELSFSKILSKKGSFGKETSRRLSIYKTQEHHHAVELDNISRNPSSIRSLFLQDVEIPIIVKVFDNTFLENVNLLKVLDLLNVPIDYIPKEVGTLLNLRYLSLRGTRVSSIPKTIGKLEKLQTLDLKQTFISELPKEFNQLHNLRHLLGYHFTLDPSFDAHCMKTNGVKIPQGLLGKCSQLQKLAFFDLNAAHRNWITELGNLTQLRKLGITGFKSSHGPELSSVINHMNDLEALSVFTRSKTDECIDLRNVMSPPRMLKRLYLNGPLPLLPSWISRLQNLVKIRLRWSKLPVDPFESLQLLPNLVELQLLDAFTGYCLVISNHGFQKLKVLQLLDLHPLRNLFIAEGGLPRLEELSIGQSENLEVPSEIRCLSTLTTLNFYNMSQRFTDGILPDQFGHIPTVLFHNKDLDGNWQTCTLR